MQSNSGINTDTLYDEPSTFKRWLVLITGSLLFFLFIHTNEFIKSNWCGIDEDFGINAVQLGNLSGMYFYGNFLLLFPAGLLLDRFSPKKTRDFSNVCHDCFHVCFPAEQ